MATVNVLTGDCRAGVWQVDKQVSHCLLSNARGERIDLVTDVKQMDVLMYANSKNFSHALLMGMLGAAPMGLMGAVGQFLIGEQQTRVLFTVETRNKKRFMAVTDARTWHQIGVYCDAQPMNVAA